MTQTITFDGVTHGYRYRTFLDDATIYRKTLATPTIVSANVGLRFRISDDYSHPGEKHPAHLNPYGKFLDTTIELAFDPSVKNPHWLLHLSRAIFFADVLGILGPGAAAEILTGNFEAVRWGQAIGRNAIVQAELIVDANRNVTAGVSRYGIWNVNDKRSGVMGPENTLYSTYELCDVNQDHFFFGRS